MRTGYSVKEAVIVSSSRERLVLNVRWGGTPGEAAGRKLCSFLAAMQHGRDHEHRVGSTTGQMKKYLGGQQGLPVAGRKDLRL